jgi:hypothetical protein
VPPRNLGPHVWCIHMAAAERMQVSRYVTVTSSKWYPHTSLILSLAFQKPCFKNIYIKRVLLKDKGMFWISKSLLKILSGFIKGFKTQALRKWTLVLGINTALNEKEILKSFAPFKTFGLFQCFENLTLNSKCFAKRYFNPFCVCVSKFWEKAVFFK